MLFHSDHTLHHGHGDFLTEVLLHGLTETLKLIPFLFLTYLLMEFLEHKASDKLSGFIKKSGKLGPALGGALGAIPQCGFSSVAANLYAGRVITLGTLVAVFLSTSDEMLPILISGSFSPKTIIGIILYKSLSAILVGFIIDIAMRLMKRDNEDIEIDGLCEEEGCHCEDGIFKSALIHTAKISLFILVITLAINTAIFFIGEENIAAIMHDAPIISHLLAALVGLIPNCAASVALTTFFAEGIITVGTMLSGLFAGAGVGLLILFKVNKNLVRNLTVLGILVLSGVTLGFITDVSGFGAFLLS